MSSILMAVVLCYDKNLNIKKEPSKRKALTVAWQRSSLTGRKPNYIRR